MGPLQREFWVAATAYTAKGKTQLGFEPLCFSHEEVRQANLTQDSLLPGRGTSKSLRQAATSVPEGEPMGHRLRLAGLQAVAIASWTSTAPFLTSPHPRAAKGKKGHDNLSHLDMAVPPHQVISICYKKLVKTLTYKSPSWLP